MVDYFGDETALATSESFPESEKLYPDKVKMGYIQGRTNSSYRTPAALVPLLRKFLKRFPPGNEYEIPEAVQGELEEGPVIVSWQQVPERTVPSTCCEAVQRMKQAAPSGTLDWSEITLLVDTHGLGRECVRRLREEPGINVAHIFGNTEEEKRSLKHRFYLEEPFLKASTIHSYKGWESRAMVVYVRRASTPRERAKIYTALSRLKKDPRGSYLTVVCSDPDLAEYGKTWEGKP